MDRQVRARAAVPAWKSFMPSRQAPPAATHPVAARPAAVQRVLRETGSDVR